MANKIKDKFFSGIYFALSIVVLLCFFAAVWHINNRVEKTAIEQMNELTANIATSNIQLVTGMLNNYEDILSKIEIILNNVEDAKAQGKIFHQIKDLDSSIHLIYLEQLDSPETRIGVISREIYNTDSLLFIKYALPTKNRTQICLLLDLIKFHQKLEDNYKQTRAYVTISYNNIYLYHPDDKRIGAEIDAQSKWHEAQILKNKRDTIINITSTYLNMPVYSYYNLQTIDKKPWIFTANLPNFGLVEFSKDTANDFVIISILAICSFLAIFTLWLLRWRKEVAHRRELEHQTMQLLLKEEQHKQTIISTELERLKSGLNPHFLFNSLSSLRVLITKDAEMARGFITKLSNLYRYLLKQEKQDMVTLEEELKFTQDYISLQQIRFPKKIITEISLPNELMNCKILPISLQLLVENCIKHTCISENEPLFIRIYAENDRLVVVNNYNRREPETEYSGKGVKNLIQRYAFLTDTKCEFKIENNCYFAKIPLLNNHKL